MSDLLELVFELLAHLAVEWRVATWLAFVCGLLAISFLVAGIFVTSALFAVASASLVVVNRLSDRAR